MPFDHAIGKILLFLFCILAAYEDFRYKSISLVGIGIFFIPMLLLHVFFIFRGEAMWKEGIAGMLPGFFLLGISKLAPGALGEGDGCFFVVTGLILGWKNNLLLVFYSFFLAALFSLVFLVFEAVGRKKAAKKTAKKTIPLLPFCLPVLIVLASGSLI